MDDIEVFEDTAEAEIASLVLVLKRSRELYEAETRESMLLSIQLEVALSVLAENSKLFRQYEKRIVASEVMRHIRTSSIDHFSLS